MSDTTYGRMLCETNRHDFEDDGPCLRCGEAFPVGGPPAPDAPTPTRDDVRQMALAAHNAQPRRFCCPGSAACHDRACATSGNVCGCAALADRLAAGTPQPTATGVTTCDCGAIMTHCDDCAVAADDAPTDGMRAGVEYVAQAFEVLGEQATADRIRLLLSAFPASPRATAPTPTGGTPDAA